MSHFSLRLLGALQLHRAGKTQSEFRSRRALALLVYLIANDRPIPRPELVELIWPDKEEKQGRANLRWALSYLGKLLPDALERTRRTVHFVLPEGCAVDVLSIARALSAHDRERLDGLLLDVQGDFLAGYYFDESAEFETWLITLRETWRLRILEALEDQVSWHNTHNRYEQALEHAERWLAIEPLAEEAHRAKMQLLARLGRIDAALEQYERCWRILAAELGTEPTLETSNLYKRLQQSATQPAHNLPAQPTEFVGRETEVAQVVEHLTTNGVRLVSIVGAGGMGKTRLAIEAASGLIERFIDGVAFVELSAVDQPNNLAGAITNALTAANLIPQQRGPIAPQLHLMAALRDKELLLILDNFEHLLDGIDVIMQLINGAPQVKMLVTSRERLNVRWERPVALRGLPKAAAFALFMQSARRVQADFVDTAGNRPCIVKVCRLVEGMPLAIELAAAWVRMQSCSSILATIQENLDFLSSRQRDFPARHRSMRAVFESSWALLADEEKRVAERLAVFQGGFSAEAAQVVADAGWAQLAPLVDKSLLRQRLIANESPPPVRYEMPELLRRFLVEKQSNKAETRRKHADYFASLLDSLNKKVQQGNASTLNYIDRELVNIRQAWQFALATQTVSVIGLSYQPVAYFFDMRCRWQETVTLFEPMVAVLEAVQSPENFAAMLTLAGVQVSLGNALTRLMAYESAEIALSAGLQLLMSLNYKEGIGFTLFALARNHDRQNHVTEARELYEESYELAKEIGDLIGMARATVNLADLSYRTGRFEEGRRRSAESKQLFEQFGDQRGVAVALLNVGRGLILADEREAALPLFHESHALADEIGAVSLVASNLGYLGQIYFENGDFESAETLFTEALRIYSEVGEDASVIEMWHWLGKLHLQNGNVQEAGQLAYRARRSAEFLNFSAGLTIAEQLLGAVALAKGELDSAETHLHNALRRALPTDHLPEILRILHLISTLCEVRSCDATPIHNTLAHHPATDPFTRKQAKYNATSTDSWPLVQLATQILNNSPRSTNLRL